MTVFISLVIIVSGYVVANSLVQLANINPLHASEICSAFRVAVVSMGIIVTAYSLNSINAGLLAAKATGIIHSLSTILSIIAVVVLLYGGYGVLALALSQLLMAVVMLTGNAVYLLWRFKRERFVFRLSLKGIPKISKLITYTSIPRALVVFASNMDLILVSRYLGPSMVPILHLTRRAPEFSRRFVERPSVAFMPAFSHLVGESNWEKARVVFLRLLTLIIWAAVFMSGGFLLLNHSFVVLWVGKSFYAGSVVNVLVVFGFFASVLASTLGNFNFALGDIRGNSIISFFQAVVSILLIVFAARFWGISGVVAAGFVSIALTTGWYFPWALIRQLKVSVWDLRSLGREFALILLASVVPVVLLSVVAPSDWAGFAGLSVVYSLFVFTLLYLFSVKMRNEISALNQELSNSLKSFCKVV